MGFCKSHYFHYLYKIRGRLVLTAKNVAYSYASLTMLKHKWYGKISANNTTSTRDGAKVISMNTRRVAMAVAA